MAVSNSFIYSTELVSLLLGILVHFFAETNKPEKTVEYRIIFYGITTLMFEIIFKVILDFYVQIYYYSLNTHIINCLAFLIWTLHLAVLCTMMIYVYRLSDLSANIRIINYIAFAAVIAFLLYGIRLLIKGNMYSIEGSSFELNYMFSYIEFICVLITLVCYVHILMIRKHFPRPLFLYIQIFGPLLILLQIVQVLKCKVVFSGFIYMLPFLVFYFLFHNDSYVVKTGARKVAALDSHFKLIIENNSPFDFIFIHSYMEAGIEKDELKEYKKDYWSFCRECEYLHGSIALFEPGEGDTIILFRVSDKKKRDRIRNEIRANVASMADRNKDKVDIVVIATRENRYIDSVEIGKEYIQYLRERIDSMVGFEWQDLEEEDGKEFLDYYKIKSAIIDIGEKCDLDDERIKCYAQPIYEVTTGSFKTAEALMRMELEGNLIPPNQFIAIAESVGAIHSFTKIMLNKVCRFIANEGEGCDFNAISFNCSMIEMAIPDSAKEFLEIIDANGVSCKMLRMEITESINLNSTIQRENAARNFKILHEAGLLFYLDDYGTGYSNLSRVLNMTLHTVKFDKSIFYKALEEETTEEIVRTMINAFKNKGAHVLVEGVEDESQAEFAIAHGFEYIQGFLYAKPEPINELTNYFDAK